MTSQQQDRPRRPAIDVRIENRIAIVTLDQPKRCNALTLDMWREIPRICRALEGDANVRCIVLTGASGHFSAGADISEFGRVRNSAVQAVEYEHAVDACCDGLSGVSKPTIAAISGVCIGGGCHVAVACDFRFAHPQAVFGIPAAKLSIVYGIRGTGKLVALVGMANAKRILFAGEQFGAAEAQSLGLADRIAVDPLATAMEFAGTLADNAPLSIAGSKKLINGLAAGALDPAEAQRFIDAAAASEDYAEGRRAFAEKRRPNFKGR